jgi:hypothetical protein
VFQLDPELLALGNLVVNSYDNWSISHHRAE